MHEANRVSRQVPGLGPITAVSLALTDLVGCPAIKHALASGVVAVQQLFKSAVLT